MGFDGCLEPRVAMFYASKVVLGEPGCLMISDVNNLAILYSHHLSFGDEHRPAPDDETKDEIKESMIPAYNYLKRHLRLECQKQLPDPSASRCGRCVKAFTPEQEKYCIRFCWSYNKAERREYEEMKTLPLDWVNMSPCMECKLVTYCSLTCKDAHREVHKDVCTTIPGKQAQWTFGWHSTDFQTTEQIVTAWQFVDASFTTCRPVSDGVFTADLLDRYLTLWEHRVQGKSLRGLPKFDGESDNEP